MFTSAVPYEIKRSLPNYTKADFSDSGHDYFVYIDPDVVDERFWDVAFCALVDEFLIIEGLTGVGNANRVLSTVVAIMRDHQTHYGIRPLRLQAADEKRRNLYYRMAKRLLPEWYVSVAGNNVMVLPQSFFEGKHGPHNQAN